MMGMTIIAAGRERSREYRISSDGEGAREPTRNTVDRQDWVVSVNARDRMLSRVEETHIREWHAEASSRDGQPATRQDAAGLSSPYPTSEAGNKHAQSPLNTGQKATVQIPAQLEDTSRRVQAGAGTGQSRNHDRSKRRKRVYFFTVCHVPPRAHKPYTHIQSSQ